MDTHDAYEGLFLFDPELSEEGWTKAQAQPVAQIGKLHGTVERQQPWGKRRLAYRVRKRRDGYYVLVHFTMPPASVGPLEQWCALNETMLRRLIVKASEDEAQPVEATTSHGHAQ